MSRLSTIVASLVTLLGSSVAQANGPEIGFDGGTVFPIDTDRVQLVREMVHIRLPVSFERGRCECTYWLRNLTDEDISFNMGFITIARYGRGETTSFFDTADFNVAVDRQLIPYRMKAVEKSRWTDVVSYPPDSLPVWTLSIAAGETLVVNMNQSIEWSGGGEGDSWGAGVTYVALPAKLWAGRIEYARLMFTLPGFAGDMLRCLPESTACYEIDIKPDGYRYEGSSVVWEYHDWEPSEDFSFGMNFHD